MEDGTFLLGACGSLADAATLARAGADFLEVSVQDFLALGEENEGRFETNRVAVRESLPPVKNANLFLPGSLPCVGPAMDEQALLAYAQRAFERAGRAGIEGIVFGSGAARTIPDGFPVERVRGQFVRLLVKFAVLAERVGVTLFVEPLNTGECNFINTLAEAAELVTACGHPNVMLVADTYHLGFADEGPEVIRQHGDLLRHFHVADYPSRRFPGADGQSYRPWFEALRAVGYSGKISVECRWGNIADEAILAFANLRRDLDPPTA